MNSIFLRRTFSLLAATTLFVSTAFASPRSDAWNLRRSNPAAAEQQLKAVVQSDPNDAKAWWFLTLVQKDQNRDADALQSLEAAKRADPSLGFSSAESVEKVEKSLRRATGNSGSTVENDRTPASQPRSNSANSAASAAASAEITRAFEKTGVFVAPEMAGRADSAQIQAAVKNASLKTNVAVIGALPAKARSAGSVAQALHKQLSLDNGLMIVVSDRPRSLGIYGAGFDKATLDDIAARTAKTFDSEGYAAGISRVIALAEEENARQIAAGRNLLLILIGVPGAIILWSVRRGKKRREAEVESARSLAEAESGRLATEWEKLSSDYEYAVIAETDPARKSELQNWQNRAGQSFSDAMSKLKYAQTADEFDSGRAALGAAKTEMQRARNVLVGADVNAGVMPQQSHHQMAGAATVATGQNVWADGDYEVPPMGADMPGARGEYALDFFTSQPVLRSEMVPVEVELNGRRRRVWASRESAARAAQGDPQIATLDTGSGPRAWFDAPSYNPWTGFGSQMLQMMAMQMLFNSMFQSHGGYSGGYGSGYGSDFGGGYSSGGGWQSSRDYDNSRESSQDYSSQSGEASLDSPLSGGNWNEPQANDYGSSSLDIFGGLGGGDSS